MRYYDIANLVTVTQTKSVDVMRCGYRTPRSTGVRILHQVCCRPVQISAAPKFYYSNCKMLWYPECPSMTAGAFRSTWECSCTVWEYFAKLEGGLGESGSRLKKGRGIQECLGGLRIGSRLKYILLMRWPKLPSSQWHPTTPSRGYDRRYQGGIRCW